MQASRISIDCLLLAFGLGIFYLPSDVQSEDTERPIVTIPHGTLQGKILKSRHGRNILAYMGIPYAEPPTGNLRFANPVPARSWNGTRDASHEPNTCPQKIGSISGNEDCLYLNVYIPKLTRDSHASLIPVMVYIYGGEFMAGSSLLSVRGPTYLLDEDIILITMNYRIGALGFLSTGDELASGNWGLKDQVLFLKWVQENIKYFGGNPDRVTLFGESAGAACVHLLALSKATIGLYHRIITESGSALAKWAYQPRTISAAAAFKFGNFVGCSQNTTKSLINCLRTLNYTDFISAYLQYNTENPGQKIHWRPTDEPDIANAVLTDSPKNLTIAGEMKDLPWISGVAQHDGLAVTGGLYENPASFDELLEDMNLFPSSLSGCTNLSKTDITHINAMKSFYFPDLTANKSSILANLTALIGDFKFLYPEYKAIRHGLNKAVNPRYLYLFNYRGTFSLSYFETGSTIDYGATHADEIIYLFPLESSYFSQLNDTMSETDYEMVDIMVTLWTKFAIDGKPSLSPLNYATTWEPFSTTDNYLQIGDGPIATVEARHSFFKQRIQFWSDFYADTEREIQLDDSCITF